MTRQGYHGKTSRYVVVLLPACCLGGVAKRILEKKPLETLSVPTGCPSFDKLYVFIVFSDQSRWVEKINISRSVWTPPHNLEHPTRTNHPLTPQIGRASCRERV